MVEDVLALVREKEEEAEKMISNSRGEAAKVHDRAELEAQEITKKLQEEGRKLAGEIVENARKEGEKEAAGIIQAEKKKADKLEAASRKNLEAGIKLIVDSIMNLGGK